MKKLLLLLLVFVLYKNVTQENRLTASSLEECSTEIKDIEFKEEYTTCGDCSPVLFVKWNGNAEMYELEYGPKNFERGKGYIDYQSYPEFNYWNYNLESGECDIFIRAKCGDIWGKWTEKTSFIYYNYVGIENIQTSLFSVFPNPVTEVFKIEFGSEYNPSNVKVTITDINGNIIQKWGYQEGYDASRFPSGIYFITVTVNEKSETRAIQKK